MVATKPRQGGVAAPGRLALQALSSAALALPAYAATPPPEPRVDYHAFRYREAPLPRRVSAGAQRGRFAVDGHKLAGSLPLGSSFALNADLTVETMSGASPWFITPGASGQPIQVMSGATIDDARQDLLLALTNYRRGHSLSGSLGVSEEDDYRALNLGFELGVEPQGKQYSYGFGLGYSADKLFPTDGGSAAYPDRISQADKRQWAAHAELTQVLTRQSVVRLGLVWQDKAGYLSDPYKRVFVQDSTVPDARPERRRVLAVLVNWRRYLQRVAAALHLDYRGTRDDWKVQTHSLEARWIQALGARWSLSSGLRYYTQSQAAFYAPYFAQLPVSGQVSSDYRLSPFGAMSLSAQLETRRGAWDLGLGLEHYDASAQLALGGVHVANPALLRYQLFNLRVGYRFE